MHATRETPRSEEAKTKPLDWPHVHIFTGQSADALRKAGVRPGTRVVMARDRRRLYPVGDFISGYFMDNRAGIAAALTALAALKDKDAQPPQDVYFVMASEEEVGAIGSSYASRTLPGALTLAVDIGPVTTEYQTALTAQPIIAYRDSRALYTKAVADRLWALALEIGLEPQAATWESYGSDATIPKVYGQTAQAGLICIPGENTHGYEIIHREAIPNCTRLLAAFLMSE
jgi:putative aminopeptidase FrvX